MGISIVRFQAKRMVAWGLLEGNLVRPFQGGSLREVLQSRAWESAEGISMNLDDLDLLSPVTAPCQIICQGKNYLDHLIETGAKPKDYNILFTKADSSLKGPRGEVTRPAGVRLLDYEIELGLVMAKDILGAVNINEENLQDYVAGFVMANDLSARDVQVPQKQWLKGKSYRGFCPVGPVFFMPARNEFSRWLDLELQLTVNGEQRQKASVRQLMFGPVATVKEISGIFDLRAGDLLLTGTPGGVAMRVKPLSKIQAMLAALKTEKRLNELFVQEQMKSARYLKNGDRVESTIRTEDGAIDLGRQSFTISG